MKLLQPALLATLVALCACSSRSSSASADQPQYADTANSSTSATAGASTTANVGVNAFLWRGSLDTLSFIPLVSADPFGGVIITDWWTPPGSPNERLKMNVYILGRELRSDGLRVAVFRQTKDSGVWVDSQVASSTASDIEDKILAAARALRAKANSAS